MNDDVLLSIEGITKTFPGVKALDKVDLIVKAGEVHALVGENGAGKSTLMNVISGVFPPDQGKMVFMGKPYRPANPRQAQEIGIGFVHQEMALCAHLSVSENVYIGRMPKFSLKMVDFKQADQKTKLLLKEFNIDLNPRKTVQELNIASQQVVEIVKALSLDCRLLILDEPTSSLTEKETESLFAIIKKLKSKGIGVLYISHRLAEVFRICDRVTIFRDGRYIQTKNIADTNPEEIITLMVGRSIKNLYPEKSTQKGKELLRVEGLSKQGRFSNVSFTVREGEILGFAGLVGAGRTEVARAVCGIDSYDQGSIYLDGARTKFDFYAEAIKSKLAYVTEDRKNQGLFLKMPITRNISVAVIDRLTKRMLIKTRDEREISNKFITKLRIKTPGLEQLIANLSGGNQQKVMLAKWLATDPKILFMDEPTRGIDVGAKTEIHNLLRELSKQGIGIVMISSELPEIIGMSDRVLVMNEGMVAGELEGDDITEENIMRLAAHHQNCSA
ncbi:MAG: sugar ABC transporter ATP-binding protein [Bacillota bacterium]